MQTLKYPVKEGIELGKMTEHKRSPCSVETSLTSLTSKRHKADLSAKTDTASVLLEAMEYIQFLHEQVKVLSAPYLQSTPSVMQELGPYSLRSKGLCLVPVSCTAGVARSNGADIWAPIKTTSPKFEKAFSQFH
ncbi:transcription factor bHLH153-like isoform X5 [Juglans microcarpa x Juglans regia]|uniref:transcription factor bHLH153-like isoform X5 n=1 Tax=Juglans microcarpa x Juglans regia TaxID=2249226 RepID=UPI001B7E1954|nr:transcription factor bHLH153-like isoform X5 [Juglans microcarpa x Juglans regia]